MSTNKTPVLQMHSWEGFDYVKRQEFNENFDKIDTAIGNAVPKANPSFTGNVTLDQPPTLANHAVTKAYLDAEVAKAKKYAP